MIFSWRHAIQSSDLEPLTKLVLLNLSIYMNDRGESCFPSIQQQCKDTGLSKQSIHTHLQKAINKGFISKSKHGYAGSKWARNEYKALMPQIDNGSQGDGLSEKMVVKEMDYGSQGDGLRVVKEMDTNSSYNSSVNSSYIDHFEEFWKNYPVKASQGRNATKGSKEKAKQVYLNLVKKDETLISKINQGVQNYTDYLLGNPKTNQQPAYEGNKHVVTWLNQKAWQNEYITTKLINGGKNNDKSNMPDWQQKLNERYSQHDKPKFTSTQETY